MTEKQAPEPPEGAGEAGLALWHRLTGEFTEWSGHELAVLTEVVRVVDRLAALDGAIREHGAVYPESGRVNPALVEARQQENVLARLVGVLDLPSEEPGGSNVSTAASAVAAARWRKEKGHG